MYDHIMQSRCRNHSNVEVTTLISYIFLTTSQMLRPGEKDRLLLLLVQMWMLLLLMATLLLVLLQQEWVWLATAHNVVAP